MTFTSSVNCPDDISVTLTCITQGHQLVWTGMISHSFNNVTQVDRFNRSDDNFFMILVHRNNTDGDEYVFISMIYIWRRFFAQAGMIGCHNGTLSTEKTKNFFPAALSGMYLAHFLQ